MTLLHCPHANLLQSRGEYAIVKPNAALQAPARTSIFVELWQYDAGLVLGMELHQSLMQWQESGVRTKHTE